MRLIAGVGESPVFEYNVQPVKLIVESVLLYNSIHSSCAEPFVPIHAISLITKEPAGVGGVGDDSVGLTIGDTEDDGDIVGDDVTDLVGDIEYKGDNTVALINGDKDGDILMTGDSVTNGEGDTVGEETFLGDTVTKDCGVTLVDCTGVGDC